MKSDLNASALPSTPASKFKSPKISQKAVTQLLSYAAIYFICIIYWEFLLCLRVQGSPLAFSPWSVLFAVPISLFAAALTGWFRSGVVNRLITAVIALIIGIYYCSDLIYFACFGSLFSVSMAGMGGDAITNFWWSLSGTILTNLPLLLLCLLPAILLFVTLFVPQLAPLHRILPRRRYKVLYHGAAVIVSLLCWFLVVLLLPLGGTGDTSAYGCYHSKFVDTDTASLKLGALPNTLVELNSYLFGSGDDTTLTDSEDDEDPAAALAEDETTDDNAETADDSTVTADDSTGTADDSTGTADDSTVTADDSTGTTAAASGSARYNVYDGLNFSDLASLTSDSDIQDICTYLNNQTPTSKNSYTGLFEGYNLIYICAESFSDYALNEKVTPNLCKLAGEGIVLNNYYNSFKNTTTNGEFAMLTGLWPDVSRNAKMGSAVGTMPQSATENMFPALGNMFKNLGISPRAYHNYKGSYYHRNESWPNMGFDCTFADTGLNISDGWPGSDLEMLEQSVDDYINDDQFCTYYMTFSGHGDYTKKNDIAQKNRKTVKKLLGDDADDLTDHDIAYLACHYELDQAIGYLMDRLTETGKDKNTVIVLAGDHYPYYLFNKDRKCFAGHTVDTNFEMYKSTCIMWNGSLTTPISVDTPCCNVDILPTILNLFNVSYDSRLYAGVDIFSDAQHVAQLYNKNFVTDRVMYNAADSEATWLDENDTSTDEEKTAYIDTIKDIVSKRYSMSLAIEDTDFYSFVEENVDVSATAAAVVKTSADTDDTAVPETNADGTALQETDADGTALQETNADGTAAQETDADIQKDTADDTDIQEGEGDDTAVSADSETDADDLNYAEDEEENDSEKSGIGILGILLRIIPALIFIVALIFLYTHLRRLRRKLRRRRRRKARRAAAQSGANENPTRSSTDDAPAQKAADEKPTQSTTDDIQTQSSTSEKPTRSSTKRPPTHSRSSNRRDQK